MGNVLLGEELFGRHEGGILKEIVSRANPAFRGSVEDRASDEVKAFPVNSEAITKPNGCRARVGRREGDYLTSGFTNTCISRGAR